MKYILLFFVFILAAAVIFVFFDEEGVIVSKENILKDQNINLISKLEKLPIEGKAPALVGIDDWLNTQPLSAEDLKGKVVLIDFWTYTCINCIRTFPHISEWYRKYKDNGFVLLGVHSPEFNFEKKKENVVQAIRKYNLEYPIALDNNHDTWNAFANRYWPAHYLIDVNGNIRFRHFGEGRYAETESAIQQLLLEAGLLTIDKISKVEEVAVDVDIQKIGTPEIYLGYLRINNIGNPVQEVRPDEPYTFSEPSNIEQNRFYFVGSWTLRPEFSESSDSNSKLIIRYKANKLNVVLATRDNTEINLEVKLDGQYLNENNKGLDVIFEGGKSLVKVQDSGFYNFTDTGQDYNWHTLEILIPTSGLRAFTFTFG